MNIWMILTIVGLLAVAGFVVADSFGGGQVAEEDSSTDLPSCGSASCDGICSGERTCGSPTCGASQGKTCGCGLR